MTEQSRLDFNYVMKQIEACDTEEELVSLGLQIKTDKENGVAWTENAEWMRLVKEFWIDQREVLRKFGTLDEYYASVGVVALPWSKTVATSGASPIPVKKPVQEAEGVRGRGAMRKRQDESDGIYSAPGGTKGLAGQDLFSSQDIDQSDLSGV